MAEAKDDMIRFRCHRCKKRIAAPPGHVGRKVKCPGCTIVTIVPDIPAAATPAPRSAPPKPRASSKPNLPAPPPPVAALPPANDLSQLATASYDDTYDQGGYAPEPERPRGPRIKRSHLQWISALGMSLHVLWILTLAMSIWLFVEFIMFWNNFNDMATQTGEEIPTQLIIFGFGAFFISLVFCFACMTGAMACGMVSAMGRKMNSL